MNWLLAGPVVVPIDFSEDSFAALATAGRLVDAPADLHVLHVLPVLEPAEPGIIWHTIDDESRIEHARNALQKELDQRGHDVGQIVIRFGDPGHEIADYARQTEASLIAVSSHGRSRLGQLLVGSVTDRIVRLADCHVLVLKKKR